MSNWDDPEVLRKITKERAEYLRKLQNRYREELEVAKDERDDARALYDEQQNAVDELMAKLRPLAPEIANLEACAASETPTIQMLFGPVGSNDWIGGPGDGET